MADTATLPELWVRPEEARAPVRLKLELDEGERAALAERFGLDGVASFSMRAVAQKRGGQKLHVEGSFEARVSYLCGQTLLPFEASLSESFEQIYWPAGAVTSASELDIDPLAADDPEELTAQGADVAELAFQHFSLALDPYPRHPEAEPVTPVQPAETGEQTARQSPFAVLASLRGDPDG